MTPEPTRPGLVAELLEQAVSLVEEAGQLTLQHFGTVLGADRKDDGSPVTVADREAETLLREGIRRAYPSHGILGEEFGEEAPDAEVRWIVDPIDGTRSFMQGVPLYGVLVGIEIGERPVVGVARFPALDETVAAAVGQGCLWNGRPASVSSVGDLGEAVVLTTDVEDVLARETAEGWKELGRRAAFTRTWGDCYGHCLVATGRAEAMVDPRLSSWDAAPLLPILEEAGGRFSDLSGTATIHGGSGVSTNGRLHAEVLRVLERGTGA